MDNQKFSNAVDGVDTAHSLAIMLARATADDKHANVLALQIAQLLSCSVNELNGSRSPAASNAA